MRLLLPVALAAALAASAAVRAVAQTPPSAPAVTLAPVEPLRLPTPEGGGPGSRFVMPGPLPGGPAGVKFRVTEEGATGYPIPWRDLDVLFGVDGWILKWAEDRVGVLALFGDAFDPACRATIEKSLKDGVAELNGLADVEFSLTTDPKTARLVFNFAESPVPGPVAARVKEIAAPATRTVRVAATRFSVLTSSLNDRAGTIEAGLVDVSGLGPVSAKTRTPEVQARFCGFFDASRELILASVPDLHRSYRLPYDAPLERYPAFDRAVFQLIYWRGVKRNEVSSELPEKLQALKPGTPGR